ncbi:uncharacterized protein STEHIDRAFT_159709 [Stereum hirsutum FP-91666 SS1]|uniref:uncharacterized protein n=1 Tax=Stereum hirsutum (strain FP-91666) TaxID=721885 RepID=UPI00044499D0|nr:uncharacterized protein STEHIDRAFT_159709 [Stereum hirsutum FP-91666 SS1]EIM84113.1 hypothetical protein STEHIDRAFT_159709 [Stereum hirsutum FP-91666 SS1]
MAQNPVKENDRTSLSTSSTQISSYVIPLYPFIPPSWTGTKCPRELQEVRLRRLRAKLDGISGDWSERILSGSATSLDLDPQSCEAIQNMLDLRHEESDPLLEAADGHLQELGLAPSDDALSDTNTPVWFRAGQYLWDDTPLTVQDSESGVSPHVSLDFLPGSVERSPEFYEVASQIQPRSYEEHMLIMEMTDKFSKRVDGKLRTGYAPYPHEYGAPSTRPLDAYTQIAKFLELM